MLYKLSFYSRRLLAVAFYTSLLMSNIGNTFEVYWSIPSRSCHRYNVTFPLDAYGVRFNSEQYFHGETIVVLYEKKFGLIPRFQEPQISSSAVNGGIPQKIDLEAHLRKAQEDINAAIPNMDFDGLAILDIEEWRPLWSLNWGWMKIYKLKSIENVFERFPNLSYKGAEMLAEQEFNHAASEIMISTIELGKSMRPKAKWGFYGLPYCNTNAGVEGKCKQEFRSSNNDLQFLLDHTNALYPSIYLQEQPKEGGNFRYIQAVLEEAQRIALRNSPTKPIFAFTKIEYQPFTQPWSFYSKDDLCNSLKQASDYGTNGAIVWSTSNGMNKSRCRMLMEYVMRSFGPYARLITAKAHDCSRENCNERGRCILIHKDAEVCKLISAHDKYQCSCDENFYGTHCENYYDM